MSDKKTGLEAKLVAVAPSGSEEKVANPVRAAYRAKMRKNFFDSALVPKSAKATSHVTLRAQAYGLQALRELELRSVYALFAWVANEQQAAPETVRGMTEARFGVADITELRQKDYDDVIKFLIDLRIDELKN